MVKMSPLPDDVYTRSDTALYQSLSQKDVLTLFIYNKHLYVDGESKPIDESNSQVRTEMRRNTVVAPLMNIKVCEPTNRVDSMELILGRRLKLLSADPRFDAVCVETTKLILNTANSYGEGCEALFALN